MRLGWPGLREAATNLTLALLFAFFAWSHVLAFAARPRPSLLVQVVLEALGAVLFLLRAPASRASQTPWAWLTTVGGTFAPFLLRPADVAGDVAWGQVLQTAGAALALAGMASLGRSFGLLPAVRAVRETGAYRLVRHPLYAAYTVGNLGYLASNPSLRNGVVVAASLGFQVLRIQNEERLLSGEASYRAYMRRTRWRLLPFVY
jgi:protein-S-isoprenylcysteine O-methyltransferase Ste14